MVLEGHFITHSIQPQYRDDTNPIYAFWKFTRGLTAPLFLFISGLIFTYLLLNSNTKGLKNTRLKKGLKRGLLLIAIGYLLQLNLYSFFIQDKPLFTELFQVFHILQCIGTGLLLLMLLYLFNIYILKTSFHRLTVFIGTIVFLCTPTIVNIDYINIPRCLENILITSKNSQIRTSIFPLFPWVGFVFIGATIGAIFKKYNNLVNSYKLPVFLFCIGLIFNGFYYNFLQVLWNIVPFSWVHNFRHIYEFARVGQILMIFSIFIVLHKHKTLLAKPFHWVPWNNDLFIKIGQNTLSIFVLHAIFLYQSFFGWRINTLIYKKLLPWEAVVGALLFIAFFVIWIKYLDIIQQISKALYRKFYRNYLKRKQRKIHQQKLEVS